MAPKIELLLEAIEKGDAPQVKALFDEGLDPRGMDPNENIPLILTAADYGHIDVMALFLEAGVPIDTEDEWSFTPISAAISNEYMELSRFLLEKGANINFLDTHPHGEGENLLTSACDMDDPLPFLQLLLEFKADPNFARVDGWTPLMITAHKGNLKVAKFLLENGADPLLVKGEGPDQTDAVRIAEYWGQTEMVELLKQAGAPNPLQTMINQIRSLTENLSDWFKDHAPPIYEELRQSSGSSEQEIRELEKIIDKSLPVDLRAWLTLFGENPFSFWEYEGLRLKRIISSWKMLDELVKEGAFDEFTPWDIKEDNPYIRCQWWHPGWLPFAMDGCGNYYCIDLDPPTRAGSRGQVIAWEKHGGPCGPMATSFLGYLQDYRDKLLSGKFVFDEESGTFDSR